MMVVALGACATDDPADELDPACDDDAKCDAASSQGFEIFKGVDGKYYFHVVGKNGRILMRSQAYTTKASATKGVESLWSTPRLKLAAQALLGLAAVQALWVTGVRLTGEGAYEICYRAGLAIREAARSDDRVLITVADERQFTPYYADRFSGGVEPGEPALMIHPSGGRYPAATVDELERYFPDFTLVLVGDPDRAASEIAFFMGKRPSEEFRFLGPEHPLSREYRRRLAAALY
jgi:uncharacterized protein YegP (UPF0339 family)